MKTRRLIPILAFGLLMAIPDTSHANPFKKPSARYGVLMNPLGIIIDAAMGNMLLGLELQVGLHKYFAIEIVPQFAYFEADPKGKKLSNQATMYGVGGVIGPRLTTNWLRAFYLCPRVGPMYISGGGNDLLGVVMEIDVGWAWTSGPPGIVVNLGTGPRVVFPVGGSLGTVSDTYVGWTATLSFGYGWGTGTPRSSYDTYKTSKKKYEPYAPSYGYGSTGGGSGGGYDYVYSPYAYKSTKPQDTPEYWVEQAGFALDALDFKNAEKFFEKAGALDKFAYSKMAEKAFASGSLEQAATYYEKAGTLDPATAGKLAQAAISKGGYEQAEGFYLKAGGVPPGFYTAAAEAALAAGDMPKAEKFYAKAGGVPPDIYTKAAEAALAAGNVGIAEGYYLKAGGVPPGFYEKAAKASLEKKKYLDAEGWLKKAGVSELDLYHQLAAEAAANKDYYQAKSYYQKIGYSERDVSIKLAEACKAAGDHEKAADYYTQGGKKDEAKAEYVLAGDAAFESGEYVVATLHYIKAGDKAKIAKCDVKVAEKAEAEEDFEKAGIYYTLAGDTDKATANYAKAADEALGAGNSMKAGELYSKAGDEAKAKEADAKYLATAAGSELASFYWTEGAGKKFSALFEKASKGKDSAVVKAFGDLKGQIVMDVATSDRKFGLVKLGKYYEAGLVYLSWIIFRAILIDELDKNPTEGVSSYEFGIYLPSSWEMAASASKLMSSDITHLKMCHALLEDGGLKKKLAMLAKKYAAIDL